ncbi:hypothetical protein niasHT_034070 [Heterodera trifolii]|uniref:Transthyretin-like family protein n=1 Tax=Heterodera trifolii TaxID=157864 RepID=A0ABD2I4M3_9BILA
MENQFNPQQCTHSSLTHSHHFHCQFPPIFPILNFPSIAAQVVGRSVLLFVRPLLKSAPATGILVKLYDDDGLFGFDDLLAKGYTDQNGHFTIYGSTNEISKIEPKVNIYHDCNDILPCQRKISISVPDGVVYEGHRPSGLFSVGVLELGSEYGGESRDCFHR